MNFINNKHFLPFHYKGEIMTAEQTLEIRVGSLADTVPLFVEGTVQTSVKIQL